MKETLTVILSFLTITIFAQPKGYSTLDYSFEYNLNEFNNHKLKGKIKSLLVYHKENNNFHSKNPTIKLDTALGDCHKYFIDSNQVAEKRILNSDSTLRLKQLYSRKLIQELVSYQPNEIIQSRHIFHYNDSNHLLDKFIKDDNDNIKFHIKYNYDDRNRLESVIGGENYNYKYIYDELGGFYDVQYSEYNGKYTIHLIRYLRHSDTENLDILFKCEPKIKFEDVGNQKKKWQCLSKLDTQNRVVFEQSIDLISNEVQLESSFIFKNNQLVNQIYKTKYNTNDIYTFEYEKNNLIRRFRKNEQGLEKFNEFLHYNEQGDLLKIYRKGISIEDEVYDYLYTYDLKNNWTEKKEILNGKLFKITYRQIEYEQ